MGGGGRKYNEVGRKGRMEAEWRRDGENTFRDGMGEHDVSDTTHVLNKTNKITNKTHLENKHNAVNHNGLQTVTKQC